MFNRYYNLYLPRYLNMDHLIAPNNTLLSHNTEAKM